MITEQTHTDAAGYTQAILAFCSDRCIDESTINLMLADAESFACRGLLSYAQDEAIKALQLSAQIESMESYYQRCCQEAG